MPIVTVTGPDGKPYLVDSRNLKSPNEPTDNFTIGITTDDQMYQKVDGRWFRLLRTDEVNFATEVAPRGKSAIPWAFAIGRAAGSTDLPTT